MNYDETLHKYGEWKETVSPTCLKEGKAERKCSICKKVETMVLPKAEHSYELDWISKPGYVIDICKVCKHIREELKTDDK